MLLDDASCQGLKVPLVSVLALHISVLEEVWPVCHSVSVSVSVSVSAPFRKASEWVMAQCWMLQ